MPTRLPFNDKVKEDGCLVISRDNFKNYFGPVFASHANFALIKLNPSFSEPDRMKECIPQVGDITAADIVDKRPFKSQEDFHKKVSRDKHGIEKYERENPGKKVKLDYSCPNEDDVK
ncbi:hypothetical protein BGX26_005745 [Mortierella sp. AD094]|nr:hypothetical protein BGX26_005745 [Mortierella sp. AD094]